MLLPPSNLDATCQQPLLYCTVCVQILKAAVPEETLADSDVVVFIRILWQAWKTQDPELYLADFFYYSFFLRKALYLNTEYEAVQELDAWFSRVEFGGVK